MGLRDTEAWLRRLDYTATPPDGAAIRPPKGKPSDAARFWPDLLADPDPDTDPDALTRR